MVNRSGHQHGSPKLWRNGPDEPEGLKRGLAPEPQAQVPVPFLARAWRKRGAAATRLCRSLLLVLNAVAVGFAGVDHPLLAAALGL
jgi:hypothetical protein